MAFSCDDLLALTAEVVDAWRAGADGDWSAPAGTLTWSCTETADHAVDTVFAPALFLASRNQDHYPAFGLSTMGTDASPAVLIEGLQTATTVLAAVVGAAGPETRAIIWRRPTVETAPPADFVPRGALELILHAHDVCAGLGVPFNPGAELCERLRQHTQAWPHWTSPGWSALALDGDPWTDLLRGSGRLTNQRL